MNPQTAQVSLSRFQFSIVEKSCGITNIEIELHQLFVMLGVLFILGNVNRSSTAKIQ
jgi:hypothetical protein